MAGFDSIHAMMESCAAEAVQTAGENFGFVLDYSDGSIEALETILANVSAGLNTGDKEAVEQAVKVWGSYLGETARRSFGGAWDLLQYPGRAAAVPALVVGGAQLYPLMKVYRRLTMGEPENVWKFYERIRSKLCSVHPAEGSSS